MCGRFALTDDWSKIIEYFGIQTSRYAIPPRYNIAPSQKIPAVIMGPEGERRIGPLAWGLIPQAWVNENPKVKPINARLEGLRKNNVFRRLLERRRCLIPASGYFEWHQNTKQPHYIRVKSRPVFAFAGFYDTWRGSEGQKISTCTIITCPPNARMRHLHDRMPAILRDKQNERFWLDRSVTDINELLTVINPYPEDDMHWYRVDKIVGNVNNDSTKCVEELK